jgi:integration host factor subunit beta
MNRSDIINKLSDMYPNVNRGIIEKSVKGIFSVMTNSIADGVRVEIRGFACFSLKERSAGLVRNPRAGIAIPSESRNVVYFRAGKELKDRVNLETT